MTPSEPSGGDEVPWIVRLPLGGSTRDADDRDMLEALLWDYGTTGLAEVPGVEGAELLAGFGCRREAEVVGDALTSRGHPNRVEAVDATAWSVPDLEHIRVGERDLVIEVGTAFGHGGHPTTVLALDALVSQAETGSGRKSLLDVGTGTGILALAAAALGYEPVVATEIDPAARRIAEANARTNQLAITITDAGFDDTEPGFDLIVANMLVAEFEPLAPGITARLAPAGRLFVTGFLTDQVTRLDRALPELVPGELVPGADGWCGRWYDPVHRNNPAHRNDPASRNDPAHRNDPTTTMGYRP